MQENCVDWPDCVNDWVGNIRLSRIMGAEVRLDLAGLGIGVGPPRAADTTTGTAETTRGTKR